MNSSILGTERCPLHILGYPWSFSGSPKCSSNSLGDDPEMAPGAAGDTCQFGPLTVSAWAQQLLRQDIELDLQLLRTAGARCFLHNCQEVQPVLGRASPAFQGHLNHGAVRLWARILLGRD